MKRERFELRTGQPGSGVMPDPACLLAGINNMFAWLNRRDVGYVTLCPQGDFSIAVVGLQISFTIRSDHRTN